MGGLPAHQDSEVRVPVAPCFARHHSQRRPDSEPAPSAQARQRPPRPRKASSPPRPRRESRARAKA
eukprot:9619255-Alexandrium_andersonii.AAC.1